MPVVAPKPLFDLLEAEWTTQVIGTKQNPGLARIAGFRVYHTLRSKGSEAGYPDWSLFRERHLYLELKRESGKLSVAQKEFVTAIAAAGVEIYVARPSDLERLQLILSTRSRDGKFLGKRAIYASAAAAELRDKTIREATL